jgi:hypothetical protein
MAISIVMLLFSCYRATDVQKPILSEQEMIPLLKEIHLAEALLTEITDKKIKDSVSRYYYQHIFENSSVSETDFEQSMQAYFTQANALDSLYQKVIKVLAAEKKAFLSSSKTEDKD